MKGIKIAGLVAAMTLSLAAFAASASASSPSFFTAGSYPATISNSVSGELGGTLSVPRLGTYNCASPSLGATLSKPSESVATSVNFNSSCGNVSAQECEFTLHPPAEGTNGTFDIGGTSCSGMTGEMLGSPFVILSQSGLDATFENEGSGSTAKVKVGFKASGVDYEITKGAYKGLYTDGSFSFTAKLSGNSTGVQVSPWPGLSVIGEGESQVFHSDLYPATIGGGQIEGVIGGKTYAKNELGTAAGAFKCNTATLATSSFLFPNGLGEDVETLFLSPTYSGCTLGGMGATVTPEAECFYNVNVAGYYDNHLTLCGLEIKVTGSVCKVITTPATKPGLTFTNVGSGSSAEVEVKADASGFPYEVVQGNKCPNGPASGSYSNGTYKGAMALKVAKVG